MAEPKSQKHQIIDSDKARIVIAVSVTVFVVIFCLFAIRALISQSLYNNEVISGKKTALRVLNQNASSVDELERKYVAFNTEPINVIGGNPTGDGPQDGNNAKIVLDALPAVFDYPALSSSFEKILTEGGYPIVGIGGGSDSEQLDDATGASIAGSSPEPVDYAINTATSAVGSQNLLQLLERSIRPFSVKTIRLDGSSSNLSVSITLDTYYQPATGLQVTTKVVK